MGKYWVVGKHRAVVGKYWVVVAEKDLEDRLELEEMGLVALVLLGRKYEDEILFGLIVELPWKVDQVLFVLFFLALVEGLEGLEEEVVVAMVVVLVAEEVKED